MKILDENFFNENKNGRVNAAQLDELKSKANIWLDLIGYSIGIAIVGLIFKFRMDFSWLIIAALLLGVVLIFSLYHSATLIKYYWLALPDARAKRLALASGKLSYDNGYFFQTEDESLFLLGDKNSGLMLGDVYEVYYLQRAKIAVSASVKQSADESQKIREFNALYAQVLGFTEADLEANRDGKLSPNQNAEADEGDVAQVEGKAYITAKDIVHGRRRETHYYFSIHQPEAFLLEIPKEAYAVLVSEFYYRAYYLSQSKRLLSVEALSL